MTEPTVSAPCRDVQCSIWYAHNHLYPVTSTQKGKSKLKDETVIQCAKKDSND